MKLRSRALFFIFVGSILAISGIYWVSQSIILSAFQRLEERGARADALRVVGLVREERARLLANCTEWARWDTTSDYVRGASQAFLRRSVIVPTFANQDIDNLVLVDTNGQVVLAQGFDLHSMTFVEPSAELLALVGRAELRARVGPSGISGIVMLGDGPAILAAHPITRPTKDATSQGLLFITCPLSPDRVAAMGRTLQLTPQLYIYDDPTLPLDREAIQADADYVHISMESNDQLTSYVMMPDLYGRPAIVWGISTPRSIRQQGRAAIRTFAIITSLIVVGFGGGTLVLLNCGVIRPLGRLSRELRDVGASGDLARRVTVAGEGEFAALAREANGALAQLEENRSALQQSEALWRSLVQTIPDLIFRVAHWSPCPAEEAPETEPLLTTAAIELVSQPPWAAEHDLAGIAITALRTVPPGAPYAWPQVSEFAYGSDGQRRIYEARFAALDGGEMLGIIRDVTTDVDNREALSRTKGELEARVEARTQELLAINGQLRQEIAERQRAEGDRARIQAQLVQSQRMEAIGLLAGGVAHDFNNLLTTIQGYNEMALMDTEPDSALHSDLEQVAEACARATSLTRQLLLFSRRQPMVVAPVQLNATIENLTKMLRRLIGEDIAIELHLEPSLRLVDADEGRIEQIITNLVVNARDAMPQGGTVTILSENVPAETLPADMPVPATGRAVRIAVSDTGIGMDDHVLAHCFEPFFTTKEAGKGTGMGLAVVYGILQQHHGGAAIASRAGQGTTISCYLPAIANPADAVTVPMSAPQPGAARGGQVMLVEDDPGVRAFTARVLQARHFSVVTAGSSAEALALFERTGQRLDLVITDVVLPGGDGLGLIDELRARRTDLRILVSSGYLDDRSRREDLVARGFPYLAKPYGINDLLAAVDAALAGGRPSA